MLLQGTVQSQTSYLKKKLYIDYFIWVMIYHKLILNLKSQKGVLTLTGVLSNNDNLCYDFTQNWQISVDKIT